jgi:putative sterol carrier protein
MRKERFFKLEENSLGFSSSLNNDPKRVKMKVKKVSDFLLYQSTKNWYRMSHQNLQAINSILCIRHKWAKAIN